MEVRIGHCYIIDVPHNVLPTNISPCDADITPQVPVCNGAGRDFDVGTNSAATCWLEGGLMGALESRSLVLVYFMASEGGWRSLGRAISHR